MWKIDRSVSGQWTRACNSLCQSAMPITPNTNKIQEKTKGFIGGVLEVYPPSSWVRVFGGRVWGRETPEGQASLVMPSPSLGG